MRDILTRARALVERGWTQGAFARDWAGEPITRAYPGRLSGGACYCAAGAIAEAVAVDAANDLQFGTVMYRVIRAVCLANALPHLDIWNDEAARTKAEVLAAFDRAISACKAEPIGV